MGYTIGIALLILTSIATFWVTWQSSNLDKEQYSLAELKKFSLYRDLLLLFWMANVAYWALAAIYGWIH